MKSKTFQLLLATVISFGVQLNQVIAQSALILNPTSAVQGSTINVNFTGPSASFGQATSCITLTTSNIKFKHTTALDSFTANSFTILNATNAQANITIPPNTAVGSYDVSIGSGCPMACSGCFTVNNSTPDMTVFLTRVGASSQYYPGGVITYNIKYKNDGNRATSAEVKLVLDTLLVYQSTSLAYASKVGDTIKWNIANVNPNASGNIQVTCSIPDFVNFFHGVTSNSSILVTGTVPDAFPSNNSNSNFLNLVPTVAKNLSVDPASDFTGSTVNLKFTSSNAIFTGASNCATYYPHNIVFHKGADSFTASSITSITSDTIKVTASIPSNQAAGNYSIRAGVGACYLSCTNCFQVNQLGNQLKVDLSNNQELKRSGTTTYTIDYENKGSTTINGVSIRFNFPSDMTYNSSSLAYTSAAGDSIIWNLGNLISGATGSFTVTMDVTGNFSVLGTTLQTEAIIRPIAGDVLPADNTSQLNKLVKVPDMYVAPDTGQTASTLTLAFTGSTVNFTSASTCWQASNITFTHESGNYSFQPSSTSIITADSLSGSINIPSNALFGMYDIDMTSCNYICADCFEVTPGTLQSGQNLSAYVTSVGSAIRGYDFAYNVNYQNYGTDTVTGLTVKVVYDSALIYSSSSPAHSTSVGDTLTWNLGTLHPGLSGSIVVNCSIPATKPLGDSLYTSVSISPLVNEVDSTDNFDTTMNVVVGSYDPNEKYVEQYEFITVDHEVMNYLIRFQNTGTAPAIKVVISDTISDYLDLSTIDNLNYSHPYSYVVDTAQRVINWTFDNINLPDSGTDWLGSQGFIEYRINTAPPLIHRDSITNEAAIYFDFNAPVITGKTVNKIFDCDSIVDFTILDDSICVGDLLEASYTGFGAEDNIWAVNFNIVDSTTNLSTSWNMGGTFLLSLTSSNQICLRDTAFEFYSQQPVQPNIAHIGNWLVSDISGGNQWYRNDTLLASETNDSLEITSNGWYKVENTDNMDCSIFSDSLEITYVGMKETADLAKMKLYPNPAFNLLQIEHSFFKSAERTEIYVYDLSGKTCLRNTHNAENQKASLDISSLEPGIYLIRIIDSSGDDAVGRFIKSE